jgi:hypothetical protein
MKLDKQTKKKVVEAISDKVIEEKVNESRDMILNYRNGIYSREEVTKKEIRHLMKSSKKEKKEKNIIRIREFFVSLIKKLEFKKFRSRNEKLLNHRK